jgi:hypothetical protein
MHGHHLQVFYICGVGHQQRQLLPARRIHDASSGGGVGIRDAAPWVTRYSYGDKL